MIGGRFTMRALLERKPVGANDSWGQPGAADAVSTGDPLPCFVYSNATRQIEDGQAQRDEATIKLIALDLSCRGGLKSERAGDYSFTLSGDPVTDREAILSNPAPRPGLVTA